MTSAALVTGAGIGIGRATALALGRAGHHVVVTDVLEAEGGATARDIVAAGGSAEFRVLDVRSTAAVEALVADIDGRLGGIAVLVNNAGIAHRQPLATLTDEQWDLTFDVDLKGMVRTARAAAPGMARRGGGAIVCLSSIAGASVGWAEHVPYSAAKAGITGLVKALAVELAPGGIRVNGIAPGLIRTAQSLSVEHSVGAEGLAAMTPRVPLGRIGAPEDIADVALFLVSDASRYVTGQTLVVDGGLTVAL